MAASSINQIGQFVNGPGNRAELAVSPLTMVFSIANTHYC